MIATDSYLSLLATSPDIASVINGCDSPNSTFFILRFVSNEVFIMLPLLECCSWRCSCGSFLVRLLEMLEEDATTGTAALPWCASAGGP